MTAQQKQTRRSGSWVTVSTVGEPCRAFIPAPLPPQPAIQISPTLQAQMDKALLALGRLDSLASLLPETSLFLYMYVRKEAVLSSQIEGTQSSLSDLLLFEMEGVPAVPLNDVQEVSNYVAAMEHGLKRLREGFPLSVRLLREIHEVLLRQGRGAGKEPGELRRSQNWIGGTRPGNARYVPPPATEVPGLLSQLEKFLHDKNDFTPLLLKAGLAHVQFETIHPFLDGNGRLGRLLITLLFCSEQILQEPLLYLSLYFKQHRDRYYELLQRVRTHGDWESWLVFFVSAVRDTAEEAIRTAKNLMKLAEDDRRRIEGVGRSAGSALRAHEVLLRFPIITVGKLAEKSGLSFSAAGTALKLLQKQGLVNEVTGNKRNRFFAYSRYTDLLSR